MRDFSTISAPLTKVIKNNIGFKWGEAQEQAFNMLKDKLSSSPLLTLPNFSKTFEIECDASGLGIGAVQMQDERPIAYFFISFLSLTKGEKYLSLLAACCL